MPAKFKTKTEFLQAIFTFNRQVIELELDKNNQKFMQKNNISTLTDLYQFEESRENGYYIGTIDFKKDIKTHHILKEKIINLFGAIFRD